MLIKICGMTCPEDIRYVNENHVDMAGFVLFFPKSKRNLSIESAKSLMSLLNKDIKKVAVVVSPSPKQIEEIEAAGFDMVQIHGSLPTDIIDGTNIPILKAFNVNDMDNYTFYHDNPKIIGYVFDAAMPGSGRVFDWSLINHVPRDEKLFILAGGLTPQNVSEAIKYITPDGVDTSSGVEYNERPGKDPQKIAEFVKAVKAQ